jgi:cytosolic phospholipase A2
LQYEQDIYDRQHSEHTESTDDLQPDFEKMGVDDQKDQKHHGFRDKIKTMIKEAFPEAITDIKIMGGMTALETRVKKEIHDPKLFPEVDKVATVRRGVDLCPEEQAFLKARKVRARDNFAKYIGVKPEDVDPRDVPTVSDIRVRYIYDC